MVQGGKHTTSLGGTAYVLTSGPTLAVHQAPAARLFAWAITNTSTLAQAVGSRCILWSADGRYTMRVSTCCAVLERAR